MAKTVFSRAGTASRYVLSPDARDRIETELLDLQVARGARACEHADLCGDVADIAELAARDMTLEMYDRRIAQLRTVLAELGPETPQDPGAIDAAVDPSAVRPGVVIDLRFGDATEIERFVVGDIAERADAIEVITPTSPLGRALIGARRGDSVRWAAPRGTISAAIVDVEPFGDVLSELRAS